VNLFAPFSIEFNKGQAPTIKKSLALAGSMTISLNQENTTENSIKFAFDIVRQKTAHHKLIYVVTDIPGTSMPNRENIVASITSTNADLKDYNKDNTTPPTPGDLLPATGAKVLMHGKLNLGDDATTSDTNADFVTENWAISVSGLNPSTNYYVTYFAYNGNKVEGILGPIENIITTTAKGVVSDTKKTIAKDTNADSYMPSCGIADSWFTGGGTILGCVAQMVYYVLFVPTSYLFGLAGMFFDTTFGYSIQSSSYQSSFVVGGWGLVRDFCNIFFIFVLLYIAFATILGVHGFKTKDMIINVVIIGLLINFSLFASQVIIDTSNILARVFYNSDAIKVVKDGVDQAGASGIVPISESIVSKVNPQNLIRNADQVTVIDKANGTQTSANNTSSGLGVGGFILITLLATAINVVGFIVFLSIGMMCITRVIGLWLYMIMGPLAFFSYTVPKMQGLKMIGWKNWWSQLLCYSFWAPLLIFFLYLTLKFMELGFGLGDASQATGIKFILGVTLPFIFIMMLLWKAKGLAKTMGCELAEQITGGIAAVGAVALGGAALGGAALLRNTVGSAAKYVQNKGARDKDSFKNYNNWSLGKKLNPFSYGKATVAGIAKQTFKIPTGGGKSLGTRMQEADKSFSKIQSANSTLDAAAAHEFGGKMGYAKDVKYKDLKESEQHEVREEVDKDFIAKKAFGQSYKDIKDAEQKSAVDRAHTELTGNRANYVDPQTGEISGLRVDVITRDPNDPNSFMTTQKTIKGRGGEENDAIYGKSQAVGEFVNALRKGSMDIRNLSQAKSSSKGFSKFAVGLLAAVAAGTRMGLKQSGVNHGTGQKDLFKDLGNTIKEALKSVDIKVSAPSGGGGGHDDHGGGGHH
jgi:hypothetical protein